MLYETIWSMELLYAIGYVSGFVVLYCVVE